MSYVISQSFDFNTIPKVMAALQLRIFRHDHHVTLYRAQSRQGDGLDEDCFSLHHGLIEIPCNDFNDFTNEQNYVFGIGLKVRGFLETC